MPKKFYEIDPRLTYSQIVALSVKARHLRNIDCLIFVKCPLLVLVLKLIGFFSFAAAIYRTTEANKVGGT